eukprot:jgi/Tetstr1/463908/TSEL_008718.t1
MGNCFGSTRAVAGAEAAVFGRFDSRERLLHTTPGGAQVEVQAASWAARSPAEDAHVVIFSGECAFVGLFDGAALSRGHGAVDAVRLCKAEAWPLFKSSLEESGGSARLALAATFDRLEERFFDSAHDNTVKAYTGASVTLVWINLALGRAWVASHGGCLAVQGVWEGALSGQYIAGTTLPGADNESRLAEVIRDPATVENQALVPGLDVSRALGLGALKREELAAWHRRSGGSPLSGPSMPRLPHAPIIQEVTVSLEENPLIVGSGGLWGLLSPTSALAWCYSRQGMPPRATPAQGSDTEPTAPGGPAMGTADSLLLHALSRAASKLPPTRGRKYPSVDDMERVACAAAAREAEPHAGGICGAKAPKPPALTRLHFHDDLTCLVVSAKQPRERMRPEDMPVGHRTHTHAPRVRGWELCQALYRFHTMRRKALLHKWFGAIEAACSQHRKLALERAKKAEVDAWVTERRAIQVDATSGAVRQIAVDV